MVTYGSVCSGIEAATCAWHPLGWRPAFFSEIEKFPRAVLAHHYPDVPCHGDFTTIGADEYGPIDLLVGGTPCQSFSIAGLRGGLADDRGNLALEFLRLAQRTGAKWLVWENVPGVLSSGGGRDFGSILGGLVELGYGFAYRVLDAQFFGVPQRRRRVFVVGYLGDWRRAAAVLFERHSLQGNPAPRREKGEGFACFPESSIGGFREDTVAGTVKRVGGCLGGGSETFLAHSLRGEGFDASEDGTGRGTPLVAVERVADTLTSNGDAHSGYRDEKGLVAIPINTQIATRHKAMGRGTGLGIGEDGEPGFTLQSAHSHAVGTASAVRRLTPRECERLQGFPDDYTLIPWRGKPAEECPDGPRYKALGNSMAVPVMAWIGERIQQVEALSELREAA